MNFIDRIGWRRFLRLLPWRRTPHDEYLAALLGSAGVVYDVPSKTATHKSRSDKARRAANQHLALDGSIGILGLGGATSSALKDQLLLTVVFIVILALCFISLISGATGRATARSVSPAGAPQNATLTDQPQR
ncbi:hypothetical protein ADL00_09960 [Streptomyces sp. AS58]|uniref:hypothetical protein n=1 Tax=Streptomyces sp. AS58 TaxID=1519489 RepID=UPI0006AF37C8|nr:hypothetical protein [Streptomyces sp. AS58]KOV70061.1 hypothetical protein ADL00_09960 [Streptomyces sp. AS58]